MAGTLRFCRVRALLEDQPSLTFTVVVLTLIYMNKPAGIERGKAAWYLRVAEWGCYFLICLGPVLASVLTAQDAPRAASMLLCLGVMLLGITGLAVVVGHKYKPRL